MSAVRLWEGLIVGPGLRAYHERWVDNWAVMGFPHSYPGVLFAGCDAYAQLVYAIEVKPNILETDPGPLDARVP